MSVTEEDTTAPGARGEGYLSPALSRLQEPPPRPSAPIRSIADAPIRPTSESTVAQRVTALEARLAELEQQQLALVDNLCQAHEAYSRLVERVGELAGRLETES